MTENKYDTSDVLRYFGDKVLFFKERIRRLNYVIDHLTPGEKITRPEILEILKKYKKGKGL